MAFPDVMQIIPQVSSGDCVIACLAMVCQKAYQDVIDAAEAVTQKPYKRGLGTRDTRLVASMLGTALVSRLPKTLNLDEESGVLFVTMGKNRDHAVVLMNGIIYDPADGMLYNVDAFMASNNARPLRLLMISGDDNDSES